MSKRDCSGVADVAPLVKTSFAIKTTFLISLRFSRDNNCIPLRLSPKLTGSQSSKMAGSNCSLVINESWCNPQGRLIRRSWFHLNDLLCLWTLRITAQPDQTLWIQLLKPFLNRIDNVINCFAVDCLEICLCSFWMMRFFRFAALDKLKDTVIWCSAFAVRSVLRQP